MPALQLIATNNPDLILFVGEALVGNEAVDQLVKFNKVCRVYCCGVSMCVKFDLATCGRPCKTSPTRITHGT